MKKFIYFIAVAVAALGFAACEQEIVPEDQLVVVSSQMEFGKAGATMPISFYTNTSWTISCDKTWVSFDVVEGEAGEANVTMTVAANDTYETRKATVSIVAGSKESSFDVTQGYSTVFDAEVSYALSYKATSFTFTVTTNADYTVEIPEEASWIAQVEADTKAAPSTAVLNFAVEANNEDSAREATIVVNAGEIKYGIHVAQDNQAILSDPVVTYLGRKMHIYDSEVGYGKFAEYYVEFMSGDAKVALALNGAVVEEPLSSFPTGVFGVDESGKHSVPSFTVFGIDTENYTTAFNAKGEEISIVDGTIDVKATSDSTYAFLVALETEEGKTLNYKYEGALPEAIDDSFGAMVGSATYNGEYDTYYANKNKKWSFEFYTSCAPSDTIPYISTLDFNFYADSATPSNISDLPAGTYKFGALVNEEGKYGHNVIDAFSFTGSVYNVISEGKYETYEINEGTITVSNNENGTKHFAVNIVTLKWSYDDDSNKVYAEETTSYIAEFDVKLNCKQGLDAFPDVDYTFKGEGISLLYIGFYYGKPYANIPGSIAWRIGWNPGSLDYNYGVNLPLISAEDATWVFEKNYVNNRFCNTPIPNGTYTYEAGYTPKAMSIGNWESAARKAYITNSYTGTTTYVKSGSVTFKDGNVSFDLNCESADASVKVKFTGSFATSPNYIQDYTTSASRIGQSTWAVAPAE